VDDVDWFEADGTCSVLHAGDRRLVIRETLDSLESRLDPAGFLRLHRSTLVNLSRVVELRHPPNAALSVVLRDGTELSVSRRRRDALLQLIGPSH
jgi:two-component system LytT family response regulator